MDLQRVRLFLLLENQVLQDQFLDPIQVFLKEYKHFSYQTIIFILKQFLFSSSINHNNSYLSIFLNPFQYQWYCFKSNQFLFLFKKVVFLYPLEIINLNLILMPYLLFHLSTYQILSTIYLNLFIVLIFFVRYLLNQAKIQVNLIDLIFNLYLISIDQKTIVSLMKTFFSKDQSFLYFLIIF